MICRAPNSVCDDFIFHGRMARQCVTAQPTVVYAPNYYSTPQAGTPAPQQPRVEPTATSSATSYSTDVVWSCRREPPPNELCDAEEPRVTSVLQQDYPEVVDLGVALSDVVDLGDAKPEVVELGVAVSEVVELGLAVSEVELGVAVSEVLELGDAEPEVVELGVAVVRLDRSSSDGYKL